MTASLALHGLDVGFVSVAGALSIPTTRRYFAQASRSARKIDAKATRKMQVAVYCPMLSGVQDHEKRGVVVEMKKTMAMDSIPMSVLDDDDIGMELAIDIPDVVEVGEADVDMVILMPLMPLIDNMLLSMTEVCISALEENQKAVGVQVRFHRHKQ
ncbi:hypothetical protein LTR06_005211 [Exophiala xenobiotica]|nr:hypothetical protein LTR06_005211 [Exophiala xenobiotica]